MSTGQPVGEFLLYQTEDARTRIQVRFAQGGLWLTQQQLADLYQSTPQNVTQHIRGIYADGELQEKATCKPFLQVREERGRQVNRSLKHYNLDMVLAIGYRVRSHRGTQFRRWATEQLKGYLVKGFVLDDERFKGGQDDAYIEVAELQAQARRPMTMRDWSARLDEFFRMTEREVQTHAGKVTAEVALAQAEVAYVAFRQQQNALPSRVEQDFDAAIAKPVRQIEKSRKPARLPANKKGKDA